MTNVSNIVREAELCRPVPHLPNRRICQNTHQLVAALGQNGVPKLRSDAFAESTEVVRRPLALWLLGVLLLFVEATSEQVELRERHTS